jgi:hypothetical protein
MINFKLIGAAVILSAAIAGPALAQEVIQEPGAFAFYHPNGDLRIGSSAGGGTSNAMASVRSSSRAASAATRHYARSSTRTDSRTAAAGQ